jgi:hypothetical protein
MSTLRLLQWYPQTLLGELGAIFSYGRAVDTAYIATTVYSGDITVSLLHCRGGSELSEHSHTPPNPTCVLGPRNANLI